MYDKYITASSFQTGPTKLPRHKGFLFQGGGGNAGATFYLLNANGNTLSFYMGLTGPVNIIPIQAYSVLEMSSGLTGLYLN